MKEKNKGFTLVEVLIVLSLLGLTFSVLLLTWARGMDSSLNISKRAEELKSEILLFWDLQRKILGAKKIKLYRGNIYMITTGGSIYQGIVKCAYVFNNGSLFYYEYPYPYGALEEIEEDKLQRIGNFENFEVSAVKDKKEWRDYEGMPDYVVIRLNDREFVFETLSSLK